MSSLHHGPKIDSATGGEKKQEILTFYNSTKLGVDVVDELCGSGNVSRNSKRWPDQRTTSIYSTCSWSLY